MSGHTLVGLDDAEKRFGTRVLFEQFSLEVHRGELLALVGSSGSGKSTLLGMLAGLEPLDAGMRVVNGDGPRVAWIVQSSPVLSRRTAYDNVLLGALGVGSSREHARSRTSTVMELLGVAHLAHIRAYQLSGGEQQRIAVCRGLAANADLILADEPTASLDAYNRDLVTRSLVDASEAGAAVVVATHDESVAASCRERANITGTTNRRKAR